MKTTVGIILLSFILVCCSNPYSKELHNLLNVKNVNIRNVTIIEDCMFCSEGITICMYRIDETAIEEFICNDKIMPCNEDTSWKVFGWYQTPIDTTYKYVFQHLNYKSTKKIEKVLEDIKNVLQKDNVYYSFYIRKFGVNYDPLEAQIFVLDLQDKMLYIVISIT